jgi:2-oxoglutarate dehydrogenase E2 component (dihydrolipoamide succinyltransferase)
MSIEIKVPALGESVTEATIARWLKNEGEAVKRDEPLVELETDKVSVEVPSPAAGVLEHIEVQAGGTVNVGAVLGAVKEGAAGAAPAKAEPQAAKPAPQPVKAPSAPAAAAPPPPPSVRRIAEENKLDVSTIAGSGKRGQVTKRDALAALEAIKAVPLPRQAPAPSGPLPRAEREERVPMSRLRKTIALRLKESQDIAAQLTTFNEADLSKVMALRTTYKDGFEKKHGVKLGFMGFFVKACIAALKEIPAVNAEIDGDDIVYKNYYDIGVAVSTDRGLVVPVVRDADALSVAGIERQIGDFAGRARDNKLKLEELLGGTFTITNGGVFGSLLSTPILNMPQSGLLGRHQIQNRPVAIGDKI